MLFIAEDTAIQYKRKIWRTLASNPMARFENFCKIVLAHIQKEIVGKTFNILSSFVKQRCLISLLIALYINCPKCFFNILLSLGVFFLSILFCCMCIYAFPSRPIHERSNERVLRKFTGVVGVGHNNIGLSGTLSEGTSHKLILRFWERESKVPIYKRKLQILSFQALKWNNKCIIILFKLQWFQVCVA